MDCAAAIAPVFLYFVDWYFAVTLLLYLSWSSACERVARYSMHRQARAHKERVNRRSSRHWHVGMIYGKLMR
jgi:hypothetical protein